MAPLTPAAALAEVLARLGASPSRSVVLSGAELQGWPADAVAVLKAHGVLATGLIGLRFVTHLDVDAAGIDHALACIRTFFDQPATAVAAPAARGAAVY